VRKRRLKQGRAGAGVVAKQKRKVFLPGEVFFLACPPCFWRDLPFNGCPPLHNPRLFQSIRDLLEKGLCVPEVSEGNGCPEPLVWSIALEGKSVKQFLHESPFLLFAPFLNEFLSRIKI